MIQEGHTGITIRPHHQTRESTQICPIRNQGSAMIVMIECFSKPRLVSQALILALSPCCHRHSWWWWSTGGWGRRPPRRLTRWRPRRGWWRWARGAGTGDGRWSCTWGHPSLLCYDNHGLAITAIFYAVYNYCNNVGIKRKRLAF